MRALQHTNIGNKKCWRGRFENKKKCPWRIKYPNNGRKQTVCKMFILCFIKIITFAEYLEQKTLCDYDCENI